MLVSWQREKGAVRVLGERWYLEQAVGGYDSSSIGIQRFFKRGYVGGGDGGGPGRVQVLTC